MASPPKYRDVFRLSHPKYPQFDGTGAFRVGSRWVSPGSYVVHAAESYALAVLENLVHWQASTVPPALVCVRARIPAGVSKRSVQIKKIKHLDPNDYRSFRKIGDAWYDDGETAVLWVPSVVSPFESNVLVNQTHSDFKKIKIVETLAAPLDPRLFSAT
jgi:RES domain-containing protein